MAPVLVYPPQIFATQAAGSTVTYTVNAVTLSTIDGFDISVRSDPSVLIPNSNDLTGSVFSSFSVTINCVNNGFDGNGVAIPLGMPGNIGCGPTDGPGIAHLAGQTLGGEFTGDGQLFAIHYIARPSAFTVTASPARLNSTQTSTITVTTSSLTNLVIINDTVFNFFGAPVAHSTRTALYGGFTVSLQATPNSPNLTATISPTTMTLDVFHPSATAKLSFSGNVQGTYTVIVSGTSAVTPTSSTTVIVIVSGDFTLSATPVTIFIETDDTGASTILVTSLGTFAGQVCLSLTGGDLVSPTIFPTCVNVVAGGSAQAILTVAAVEGQTPSGTYFITVTGTSDSTSHTTIVTVVVLSDLIRLKLDWLDLVSVSANGGVMTWTATLTNRAPTTQYVIVTITGGTSSGTHPFSVQSTLVTLAPGASATITISRTFTGADIGSRFRATAMAQFGSTPTNLNQFSANIKHGFFTVVA
jgi:hypothetical protein